MKKEVYMRTNIQLACALLACVLTSGVARAESPAPANYSRSEVKSMIRDAHTTEQYMTLASYFRWRQQQFEQQAHEQITWWAQRSMNVSLPEAAKYPSPADSSRYRYEYFNYEAQQMSRQAAHYESLSAHSDHQ
jgi:hypothetical protein